MESTWNFGSENTATADVVPVIAEGHLVATLEPIWSDEDGVRVSVFDDGQLRDLSRADWDVLRAAMDELFALQPPR